MGHMTYENRKNASANHIAPCVCIDVVSITIRRMDVVPDRALHDLYRAVSMRVFSRELPDKPLTNFELSAYARELGIPHFRGVSLPRQPPHSVACGIVNLNTSSQFGSHWVCYYRNKSYTIYFESYGHITPVEIQRYLKTGTEFVRGKEVLYITLS